MSCLFHKSFFWSSLLRRHDNPFVVFCLLLLVFVFLLFLNFLLLFVTGLLFFLGLNFVFNFWFNFWFNFMGRLWFDFSRFFVSSWLICGLGFMLYFWNHFVLCRFSMLHWLMLDWFVFNWFVLHFMLYFMLDFMLYFGCLFMLYFWLHFFWFLFMLYFMFCGFVLNLMLNFVLYSMFSWLVFCLGLWLSLFLWLLYFLSLLCSLLLFGFFFKFGIFLGWLFELFWDVSDGSPVFSVLLLLSSHFDEKSPGEYLLIKAGSDEVDGVNFALEDDFKRSRVVLLDFDEMELRECFFNIFLNCSEVAFDEVE